MAYHLSPQAYPPFIHPLSISLKTMNRSKSSLRGQLRNVHIVASIALGAFLYSPWRDHPSFFPIMGGVIFPLLTLSGLWMWQGQRIIRGLTRAQTNSQLPNSMD